MIIYLPLSFQLISLNAITWVQYFSTITKLLTKYLRLSLDPKNDRKNFARSFVDHFKLILLLVYLRLLSLGYVPMLYITHSAVFILMCYLGRAGNRQQAELAGWAA